MFVGHLAVALGAKRMAPGVPLDATVAAAFGLDLIWPVLLLLGAETVRVSPGDTAFTNLAFDAYPWSHRRTGPVTWVLIRSTSQSVSFLSWPRCFRWGFGVGARAKGGNDSFWLRLSPQELPY